MTHIIQEDYLDEVAVERAVAGHPPAHLTHNELQAAVNILSRRGFSISEIADRVGIATRNVQRHRAVLRESV